MPVKCKYEEVWDYTAGACVDINNYEENLFRFKSSGSRLIKINNAVMGSDYTLEFWYKSFSPTQDYVIYAHSQFNIQITNGGKIYEVKTWPGNAPIPH